jgi:hypothetical protein
LAQEGNFLILKQLVDEKRKTVQQGKAVVPRCQFY